MSRTQHERRTETIGKLIDATIDSLYESGYVATSTSAICKRAGVSEGGLYNHFGKRIDLIVATAEAICATHLARYKQATDAVADLRGDLAAAVIEFIRESTRTREHAAWHEIMVVARTDNELRERVAPSVKAFEEALLETATTVLGVGDDRRARVGIVALSIMHMFDSEAVTTTVYPNAQIEAARVEWATELLRSELS